MKMVAVGKRTFDYLIMPAIAILDMSGVEYFPRYRYRIALGFWNWRVSIGIGKARR